MIHHMIAYYIVIRCSTAQEHSKMGENVRDMHSLIGLRADLKNNSNFLRYMQATS